jgi:hypothetical protein
VRKDRRWELTLDGGMLCYDGLRCPPLGERDGGAEGDQRAQLENDLFLRLADLEEAIGVLDGLFAEFCTLRGGSAWQARELPALRAWVADFLIRVGRPAPRRPPGQARRAPLPARSRSAARGARGEAWVGP